MMHGFQTSLHRRQRMGTAAHRHAPGQVEIEAQAVEPDQRPLLPDVRPQHLLERGLQQVRRGVVAAHALSHPLVHRREHLHREGIARNVAPLLCDAMG